MKHRDKPVFCQFSGLHAFELGCLRVFASNPLSIKLKADKLLSEYGLTHSTFINLSYHSLINGNGIPISRNVPNDELAEALRASRAEPRENKKSYSSASEMLDEVWDSETS